MASKVEILAGQLSGTVIENAATEETLKELLEAVKKLSSQQSDFNKKISSSNQAKGSSGTSAAAAASAASMNPLIKSANLLTSSFGGLNTAANKAGSALGTITGATVGIAKGLTGLARIITGTVIDAMTGLASGILKLTGFMIGLATTITDTLSGSILKVSELLDKQSTSLSEFTAGISSVLKNLPILGNTLSNLINSVTIGIRNLEAWNKTLKDLSNYGANFNNSIIELRDSATKANMTLDEYSAIIKDNAQELIKLGGSVSAGAKVFGQIAEKLWAPGGLGAELVNMGMSITQINSGLAKFTTTTTYGTKMNNQNMGMVANMYAEYAENLDKLSKLTGKQKDELEQEMAAAETDMMYQEKMASMTAEQQARFKEGLAAATAMYGKTGAEAFKAQALGIQSLDKAVIGAQATIPGFQKGMGDLVNSASNTRVSMDAATDAYTRQQIEGVRAAKKTFEGALTAQSAGAELGQTFEALRAGHRVEIQYRGKNITEEMKKQKASQTAIDKTTKMLDAFENGMRQLYNGIIEGILPAFEALGGDTNGVKDLPAKFKAVGEAIGQIIGSVLKPLLSTGTDALPKLIDAITNAGTQVIDFVKIAWSSISAFIDEVKQVGFTDAVIKTLVPALISMFGAMVDAVKPKLLEGFTNLLTWLAPHAQRAFNYFVEDIKPAMINGLKNAFDYIVDKIGEALSPSRIWDYISNKFSEASIGIDSTIADTARNLTGDNPLTRWMDDSVESDREKLAKKKEQQDLEQEERAKENEKIRQERADKRDQETQQLKKDTEIADKKSKLGLELNDREKKLIEHKTTLLDAFEKLNQKATELLGSMQSGAVMGGEGAAPGEGEVPSGSGTFTASGGFEENAPALMKRVMEDFSLTKEQAAGIVGNLAHESAGLKAGVQEKNPLGGGRGGLGWAQWTGPRRKEFEAYLKETGQQATDPEANYGFLKKELQSTHKSSITAVKGTSTVESAMKAFEKKFEAAGVKHYDSRMKYAQRAYGMGLPSASMTTPQSVGRGSSGVLGEASRMLGQTEENSGRQMTDYLNKYSGTTFKSISGSLNAWCARFVNATLQSQGIKGTGTAIAADFKKYGSGVDLKNAKPGDIAVFRRSGGSGSHVAIVKSVDASTGKITVVGGNQSVKGSGGGVTESIRSIKDLQALRRAPGVGGATGVAKSMGATPYMSVSSTTSPYREELSQREMLKRRAAELKAKTKAKTPEEAPAGVEETPQPMEFDTMTQAKLFGTIDSINSNIQTLVALTKDGNSSRNKQLKAQKGQSKDPMKAI